MRAALARHPVLAATTGALVLAFGTVGFVRGARLTVSYLVIVGLLASVVVRADERVRFSRTALVGLAAWGVMHLAGGLVELGGGRILYNVVVLRWIHLDNVVHLVGFGSAGIAAWESLTVATGRLGPRVSFAVASVAAMGFGALNEVVEFAASHLLEATNVGGFENTGRDLVANMLGGILAGAVCARRSAAADPATAGSGPSGVGRAWSDDRTQDRARTRER